MVAEVVLKVVAEVAKEVAEVAKATSEVAELKLAGVERAADAGNPLAADELTRGELRELADTHSGAEVTKMERGNIGESLFKSEQLKRGVTDFEEQIAYSDVATKNTRHLDANFNRPRGSTFEEYVPLSGGKSGYLVERTVSATEQVSAEIKNYNPESLNLQSIDGAHLLQQIEAMRTGLPGKLELALPRDTVLAAESQGALKKISDLGVRIVTFTSRTAQAGAGLG